MNKKYGIVAAIACAIVVGVLALTFINQTNYVGQIKQLNVTNSGLSQQNNTTSSVTPKLSVTSGKHYFSSINETIIVKSNP